MWRSLALLALCAISFFVGLGGPAITDSDEAFYAESAREMVESGDWITPHFNYEPRFQKPILYYWAAAAGYVVSGTGEAQARFFSALAGLGLVWIAFACGSRWYGSGPGLMAGAVVATCYGAFAMARQSLPDLPTAFFITVAVWAIIEAVGRRAPAGHEAGVETESRGRLVWVLVASAAMGLGMLAKGPVAIVLPAAVAIPLILWESWTERKQNGRFTFPVRTGELALGAGLFLVIAAPWYAAAAWVNGPHYLYQFFVGENLQRFATSTYNEPRAIWYYVPILLGGMLPWSPFMALWIAPVVSVARRQRALTMTEVRLVVWALAPLLVLTASTGKQPRYILPCLVPIAVLLGKTIWSRSHPEPSTRDDAPFRIAGAATGLVVLAIGLLIWRAGPVFAAVSTHWTDVAPVSIAAAGLFTLVESLTGALRRIPLFVIAASTILLFVVQGWVLAPGQPEVVQRVAQAARAYDAPAEICTCGAFGRNLVFYTHAKTSFGATAEEVRRILEAPTPVLAIVDAGMLSALDPDANRYRRLFEARYLNTGLLRIGTFIHPDPARDLQRVVLVSNR